MNTLATKPHFWLRILSSLLIATGIILAIGGGYLVVLGGSWYYLIAGIALVFSGSRIWHGKIDGVWIYLAILAGTFLWNFYEIGFRFWGSVPRLAAPMFIGFLLLLSIGLFPKHEGTPRQRRLGFQGGLALLAGFAIYIGAMVFPHGIVRNEIPVTAGQETEITLTREGQWREYGRTGEGIRYTPLDQITKDNVHKLEVVWTARHGQVPDLEKANADQNTPIFVDGTVYHCAYNNIVTAVDGTTGEIKWQFDPQAKAPIWMRCRSVAFVDPAELDPAGTAPAGTAPENCGPRIVVATVDGRLISVKAKDGTVCRSFGANGVVDLLEGMGAFPEGQYMPTTGATLAGDKIVIGGWVRDNQSTGEAPGVVRAFDAISGDLKWAWDLGNPEIDTLPAEGETYTRGTPNVWAPISYDEDLNMVYLPTGNPTPDYWGGTRSEADEKYGSSVVAVDLTTGKAVWHFQTVHHDLWDYDVPSQPALIDFPKEDGTTVPALVQTTKRGQIFVLDRRTGAPLTRVEELPVPPGDAKGERYSPTQPFSTGMPQIGTDESILDQHHTWGMTPVDHLICRIRTLKTRWDGFMTPPSEETYFQFPAQTGGMNWGSASFDQSRNILIVNDLRWINRTYIIPQESTGGKDLSGGSEGGPMHGTPYQIFVDYNLLPFSQTPCYEPPYGTMTAIDMATRKVKWEIPMGTTREIGPFGLKLSAPFNVGMPTLGGAMTTRSGLTFFAATQDFFLRAIDTETGEIVWKSPLPVGSQSAPISYVDGKGRQIVLVQAAGARRSKMRGDYLIAYALTKEN
ncbi:quinate dehydrogenase (quinone) [Rhodovulum imhoffii]|uniref:Quinate dehydrogenase (Quinone) n=1 Tax=Rhodovulum imhoffii TaxID=365340 RepID=A0A2T5BNL2_9RHOB|nr:membrane-bound PQQ-dependent dehydrogenase, glucose/quinate/shikimate family [Rhodovulum imhoffii]MBK5933137.1 hypothetical protein [Rhodovulum imhoffii]PTN00544.1 quinate dehydrogenase (quinone) [Rhodovulum imhoffii]